MDNWGYVFSAYLLAFAVLLGYWFRLKRRIRKINDPSWKIRGRIGREEEA